MLVLSVASHLGLLALLLVKPSYPVVSLPGVVSVELVAAPAPASPPRAAAPPKPVPKKVVLPAQPDDAEAQAQAQAGGRGEGSAAGARARRAGLQRRAGAAARRRRGERPRARADGTTATASAGSGGGVGRPVSPEVAAWVKKAKIHVRRAWVLPPAFRTQALEAHVLVDLDAGGNVIGVPEVVRRSGNPWFDEGVVRAIQKASPLPPPPAADEWAFVFVPGDSY